MNPKDALIQKHFPTVMAPKYGDIQPCEKGKTRLVMAGTGLFIETVQPWGRAVLQLWNSLRPLPYGDFKEDTGILDSLMPDAWRIVCDEMVPRAAIYAERGLEWAGWIIAEDGSLSYLPVEFEASSAKASVKMPVLPAGVSLVVDVHSHGTIPSGFSLTDNEDDKGGVKICIVLGSYKKEGDIPEFEASMRLAIEGFFFDFSYGKDGRCYFD